MKKLNKKGFTLVELVIVIAVIAILAAVLIPVFSNVIEKANQSKALQEAKNAWTQYVVDQGEDYKGTESGYVKANDYYFEVKDGQIVVPDTYTETAPTKTGYHAGADLCAATDIEIKLWVADD